MKLLAKHSFEAIGTWWSIETREKLSPKEQEAIHTLIDSFDQTYSRFIESSLVSRINREAPGSFTFPSSITTLYKIYLTLEAVTKGAVNPLVGRSLEQLGYDAQYSLREKDSATYQPPHLSDVTSITGTTLAVNEPVLLDIGAIGKGYLVDLVAITIAKSHPEYVIDASGDVAIHREHPEIIGLEDPRNTEHVIGSISLSNQSICASAINRRIWANGLHHLIDARTGRPTDTTIVATWAVAHTTILADALATALFFTPVTLLQEKFGDFFYVTMKRDGSVEHNIHAIGEIYT